MATNKISIDEGSTTNTATNTITEDAVTKHIPRSVLNNSSGTEIGTSAAPIQVTLANTGANTNKLLVTPDLPSGASTAAKQPALGTAGSASTDVLTIQGIASMTKLLVTPDLPSGAATAAKQPALGTAGSASADVITIQGISSMTKLLVTPDLPSGAATSAKQDTIITSVGNIDTTTAALSKAEDAAHSSGDKGVMLLAVREATATDLSAGNTDGDYEPLQVDASGKLHVNPGTVTVASHAVTNAGTFAVQATEADGANSTLGAKADAKNTATDTTSVSAMSVLKQISASVQAPPSQAVTNAGTFATQAAQSGTWTVQPGNTANTTAWKVDGSAVTQPVSVASIPSHAVTNAGTFAVQESGTQVQVDDAAFTPATSKIAMAGFEADESSTDSVDEGDGGAARMTLDRKQIVTVQPHTAGGLSVFNATSSDGATALTSTAQAIKASAGQVYGWYIYNPNATAQFVQFYNTAQASVTVGTTNPLFMLTIPATSAANVEFTNGITFSNAGFSCAATATAGGNGSPSTALDAVIFYK